MSRIITALRALPVLLLLIAGISSRASAQGYGDDVYSGSASYQQFYDELSPYGQWINDPQYGYVWVPEAGDDFRPYYSNGYWTNTDYGNTWVSNYNWGWAPFHYGRWTYSNYYGWLWIPGNQWAPAWVSWRSGGGAYGWAPLGPGISINIAMGGYSCPDYWWTFTPQQYILSPRFHSYCYGPRYAPQYVHQTTIINNTYVYNHNTYIGGPRRGELERATGHRIEPVAINNVRRPGNTELRGNSLNIYRPTIAENTPRTTERPRQFRTAEQPVSTGIANGGRQTAPVNQRAGFREPIDRSGRTTQPQEQAVRANPGTFQRDPRLQSPEPLRSNSTWQNNNREQARPQLSRDWGGRTPAQSPPVQQAPQQMERQQAIDRNAEVQRAQQMQRVQEMQRAQESQRAQAMQQQRIQEAQRARDVQQRQVEQQPRMDRQPVQRTEQQPRMEAPRQAIPQRQEAAPVRRTERQPMGGGEGRRPFGR